MTNGIIENLKKTEELLREMGFSTSNSQETKRGRMLVVMEHWTGPWGVAILERWHPMNGKTPDFERCDYVEVFMPVGRHTFDDMWEGIRAAIERKRSI